MKLRILTLILPGLLSLMLVGVAVAQNTNVPIPAKQTNQKHSGFLDYALGRINPDQRNYGAEAQAERDLIVTLTVENVYFWLTVSAVLLLTGVLTMHLLSLRADEKKEYLTACLITELWNGRVSDCIEIDRRTEQYNRLIAEKNAMAESSIAREKELAEAEARPDARAHKKIERLVGDRRSGSAPGEIPKGASAEMPLGTPTTVDLGQQNMLLERRIEAMRNTEQNLRERLNQTATQLEDERKRNKALKGA
ncbi:hypothetical protein [Edaphobacter dinghuensis]|uniref:Uncharacterized protein n=1 Tax=Edaphobacter dinghuensis TaxID=1560005 RepID=A0A917HRS9_9BACT|nr:hypothetical protein [Edaphobacter dinghuensis]GGG87157.1 hypothetical protein GCM10011585_33990 [Edaphobacter dinghuensis]